MNSFGITGAVLAVACAVALGSGADAADVYQPIAVPTTPGCSPGYSWQRMAVRYQCATPQPTCAYGFASGPAWNGSAWVYSCNAPPAPPPPPICPSETNQIAAPSWNGAAWVGQQCQPSQPQIKDPQSQCKARASQDGITLSSENLIRRHSYNSYAGPATQYYYDTSTGPIWQSGGYSGNGYTVVCNFVIATGDWVPAANNPYVAMYNIPYVSGGGG
jgi:hypothetical protein